MQKKNILRYVLMAVFLLLLTAIQTSVLQSARVFGVVPNLLLCAAVSYSLTKGDVKAIGFNLCCGFLLDCCGGRVVGLNMLLCLYIALVCILLNGGLFNNNVFVAMLFVLLLSVPYEFFIYFFQLFIWGENDIAYAIVYKILPASAYSALATALVYPAARALATERTERRTRSGQRIFK